MNVILNIKAHRGSASYAEGGNVEECEVTSRYIQSREEAHRALDKVLDALGLEDKS